MPIAPLAAGGRGHNSLGGAYRWSSPLTLTVDNGISWTGPVIDVTAQGAKGDGAAAAGDGTGIVQWMLDHTISTNSTVDLDGDGDGVTLLEEYAFNMDPSVASREGIPHLQAGPAAGTTQYIFTRARAELGYRVERCTELCHGAWVPVAVNPGNAGTTVALPVTPEPGHTSGFFRLTITQP